MNYIKWIMCFALGLSACNSSSVSPISQPNLQQNIAITEAKLTGKWQWTDTNTQPPLVLQFENGTVSVLNGCNHIQARYQIKQNTLQVGSAMSTRMACEQHLMDLDILATKLLQSPIRLERFVDDLPDNITMKITLNGKDYPFVRLK